MAVAAICAVGYLAHRTERSDRLAKLLFTAWCASILFGLAWSIWNGDFMRYAPDADSYDEIRPHL